MQKSKIKNVIIICDVATINGGASKVAIQSALGLASIGMNVLFFSSVGPVDIALQDSKVKVICLDQKDILTERNFFKAMVQGIWNAKAYHRLDSVLKQYKVEETVVHSHVLIKALSPSVWAVLAKYQFKVIITLHDYFLFCPNGGLYNYQTQKICSLCASTLKCYKTNCDSRSYIHKIWRDVRQIVQKIVFAKMTNVSFISISSLNKAICFPYLQKYTRRWYELRNPIELNVKKPVDISKNHVYLFMGRLSPEKGLDLFCEAISSLGLNGIVLGDGELKIEYEEKYPNIQFVGWVSGERKDFYIRQCKALIFPSRWYEGAPLTIVELKSYGVPCIVPDMCSAVEEIENRKTGLIFESGNVNSLIESIRLYETMNIEIMQRNILSSLNISDHALCTHCAELVKIYNQC